MFLAPWLLAHGRHRLAITMALVPPALVVTHYLQTSAVGRTGLLGIGTACWFTAGALAMIRLGPLVSRPPSALQVDRAERERGPHVRSNGTARRDRVSLEIAGELTPPRNVNARLNDLDFQASSTELQSP